MLKVTVSNSCCFLTSCCGCINVRTGSKIIGIITLIYYVILSILMICNMTEVLPGPAEYGRPDWVGATWSAILILVVSIAMIVVNTFLLCRLNNPTIVKIWLIIDMICFVV